MPIRGIDQSVEENVIHLKDLSLGIDMMWYIRKYLFTQTNKQDDSKQTMTDLLFYGINDTFKEKIENIIQSAKKNNLQLLLIWPGQETMKSNRPFSQEGDKIETLIQFERSSRWGIGMEGIIAQVNEIVRNCDTFISNDGADLAGESKDSKSEASKDKNSIKNVVEILRAPYTAHAQLAYFRQSGIIDMVFSSTDYLLFDEQVIMEIVNDKVECISRDDIFKTYFSHKTLQSERNSNLKDSKENNDALKLLLLCLGCEYIQTIPLFSSNFSIATILQYLKDCNYDIFSLEKLLSTTFLSNSYVKQYITDLQYAMWYTTMHPVMTVLGDVQIVTFDSTNCDFSESEKRHSENEKHSENESQKNNDDFLKIANILYGERKCNSWYETLFEMEITPYSGDVTQSEERDVFETTVEKPDDRMLKPANVLLPVLDPLPMAPPVSLRPSSIISPSKQFLLINCASQNFFKKDFFLKLLMLYENVEYDGLIGERKSGNIDDKNSENLNQKFSSLLSKYEKLVDEQTCFDFITSNKSKILKYYNQIMKISAKCRWSKDDQNEKMQKNSQFMQNYTLHIPLQTIVIIHTKLGKDRKVVEYLKEAIRLMDGRDLPIEGMKEKIGGLLDEK